MAVPATHEQRLARLEAVGEGEDFLADVQFDSDGLVVDYPGIASRIGAPSRIVAPEPPGRRGV